MAAFFSTKVDADPDDLPKPPKMPLRQSNKQIADAIDSAFQDVHQYGLSVFSCPPVRPLGPRDERYFIEEEDPLTGDTRNRACVRRADGSKEFETAFKVVGDKHYRPTLHIHNDMCGASWYAGMALSCTNFRSSSSNDRFHRLQCDKQEACANVGLAVARLESVVAVQTRRKPWGENGNHCVMMGATKELYLQLGLRDPRNVLR